MLKFKNNILQNASKTYLQKMTKRNVSRLQVYSTLTNRQNVDSVENLTRLGRNTVAVVLKLKNPPCF